MTAALATIRLAELLHSARHRNASDVHVRAGVPPVLRVDGVLEVLPTIAPEAQEIAAITQGLLDDRAQEIYAQAGDVTVSYRDADVGRVRVHAARTADGPALAIRMLALCVPAFESLDLPPAVADFTQRPHGLVIVCGPTGSGKSTALAALIDRINQTDSKHVITIEDPIEYEHVSHRSIIGQREVGRDVPSFEAGVYGALRSDPDVLLLGEMREPSTMHAALTAAETGHLVFTTLHTGDAAQTIDRIVGAFPAGTQEQIRVQLAQTIAGVLCMRLLPRSNGSGRVCAAEVLVATDAVRHLIRDGKTHQLHNVISTNRQCGMQTLEAHLCDLVGRREITVEAAKAAGARIRDGHSHERLSS